MEVRYRFIDSIGKEEIQEARNHVAENGGVSLIQLNGRLVVIRESGEEEIHPWPESTEEAEEIFSGNELIAVVAWIEELERLQSEGLVPPPAG